MKRICLLLGVLAIGHSSRAETLAHWDFNESFATNGISLPYSTNGAFVVSAIDKSGNGNDLSIWADSATSDRTWIATNASYFGDIAVQSPGGGSYGDMRTVSNSVPGGVDISDSSFTPTNFTVEAVFTYEQAGWQSILCRQGNLSGNMASFRMIMNDAGRPQATYRTEAGTQTEVTSPTPLTISDADWHHMAVSAQGGSNLVLYVDGVEVASGSITNSGMEFDPNSGAGTDQGTTWSGGEWAVGRGMWTGSKSDGFPGKIDEIVISDEVLVPTNFMIATAVVNGPLVPAQGMFSTNRTISATLNDFGDHIDEVILYINGEDYTYAFSDPDDTSITATYEGNSEEFPAGEYTAMLVGTSYESFKSYTNTWTFSFVDSYPEPALYASELYNVNMAGCANNGIRTVPNGVALAAPSTGGIKAWNNAYGPNAPWSNPGQITLVPANSENTNSVTFETGGANWNDGPQSWGGYYNEFTAISNTIWGATQGDSNTSGWARFSGLNTNSTYDVYIYWTWNRNDEARTYQLTVGNSHLPLQSLQPNRAAVIADPSAYVEGENYVVISEITPGTGGIIELTSDCACAYQLAKRSDVPLEFITPFSLGEVLPAAGARLTNAVIEVSATLNDLDAATEEMYLYIDGAEVTNTYGLYTGIPSTNTISYLANSLTNGEHTAKIIASGYGVLDGELYSYTNEWSFFWFDHFPVPSTGATELYNVNIAGSSDRGLRLVPHGGVLAAPTTGGGDVWNNAYSPGEAWENPGQITLLPANEANANRVGFETGGSGWWDGPQGWAGYYDEFTALSNTIWGATVGDSDSGWTRFTGLDTNAAYDVYIYWTWSRADDSKTFKVTTGSSCGSEQTIHTDRAALLEDPDAYVAGVNYVVLSEITPDARGTIEIGPNYACAYQLVKRGNGLQPLNPPNISFEISGDLLVLSWASSTNASYSILSTTNLLDAVWTEESILPGTGENMTESISVGDESRKFYMIEAN